MIFALEDLFVDVEHHGNDYDNALLKKLARIVVESRYERFEWKCLSWNSQALIFTCLLEHNRGLERIPPYIENLKKLDSEDIS